MFRGVHYLSLDVKGRIAIPARYREGLGESCEGRLIVTIHPERCLLMYPQPIWEDIERILMAKPNVTDSSVRWFQRVLVGHATEVELDTQGRVLLSASLREFAGLDKKAALVGQGNKFEIWNEESWVRNRNEFLDQQAALGTFAATLENLTL